MKRWGVPLMIGFGAVLAFIIGKRMSTDAMAVVIGVAVGVAASIPTSVLIVALLRRDRRNWQNEQQQRMSQQPQYPPMPQPPVIVLNPADLLGRRGQEYTPLPPPQFMEDGGMRRLRVVGDDDDWAD